MNAQDYNPLQLQQDFAQSRGDTLGPSSSAAQPKLTASMADIAVTARKSGRTTAEVTKALRDKGYIIGGQ